MQRQHFVLLLAFTVLILGLNTLGLPIQHTNPMNATSFTQPPQDQAQQAIDAAQTAINTAFTNLVFADSVGSSISDLIGTLNEAIVELNQARQAYNLTDYTSAITLAEGAETTANAVSSESRLRGVTTVAQTQALIIPIIAIIFLSIPASYVAITRWQKYRKEKRRAFLQMEIRLPDDEEEGEMT